MKLASFFFFPLCKLLLDTHIIMTNIANPYESLAWTSQLHHLYHIKPSHIIYIGEQYSIPTVTTIRPSQLLSASTTTSDQCSTDNLFYEEYLTKGDSSVLLRQRCHLENRIADIISELQKSKESYEIIFDDLFWLYDDTVYRLLTDKYHIKRIVQLDLDTMSPVYPFFTRHIVYYYDLAKHRTI